MNHERSPFQRRVRRLLIVFGVFTVLGLSYAGLLATNFGYGGENSRPYGVAVVLGLTDWYLWLLLTPVILWLGRRFPIEGGRWPRSLAALLPAGALLTVIKIFLEAAFNHFVAAVEVDPLVGGKLHQNLVVFWAILGVGHALRHQRRSREQAVRAARLESQLATARLECLRMQLHPHFLFNTLNAIATLVGRDPERAEQMLIGLADLLRLTLERHQDARSTLRQELEFIKKYLDIEQTRFGSRLQVRFGVPAQLLDAHVPPMILQPLVENAVRHGISKTRNGGCIEINAEARARCLALSVSDSGPGLPVGALTEGVGLSNTRRRLRELCASGPGLILENGHDRGLTARIHMPLVGVDVAGDS